MNGAGCEPIAGELIVWLAREAANVAIGRRLPVEIEVMIGSLIPCTWELPEATELFMEFCRGSQLVDGGKMDRCKGGRRENASGTH